MDFMAEAFALVVKAQAAKAAGNKMKTFAWDKAARILRKRGATEASAGLEGDWGPTAGTILENGKPCMDCGAYLHSLWATPMLEIGEERIECWEWETKKTERRRTIWPVSALRIFKSGG